MRPNLKELSGEVRCLKRAFPNLPERKCDHDSGQEISGCEIKKSMLRKTTSSLQESQNRWPAS